VADYIPPGLEISGTTADYIPPGIEISGTAGCIF